jgi:hypothetical protein
MLVSVHSSNLTAVGDNVGTAALSIAFRGDCLFARAGVVRLVFLASMAAGSPGKYFHARTRGRSACRRLQPIPHHPPTQKRI